MQKEILKIAHSLLHVHGIEILDCIRAEQATCRSRNNQEELAVLILLEQAARHLSKTDISPEIMN